MVKLAPLGLTIRRSCKRQPELKENQHKKVHAMKTTTRILLVFVCAAVLLSDVPVQGQQTEAEFQKLMPITGKVETYFGDFELDHSFPTKEAADKIYELIDHQRASQLYLWGMG